MYVWNDVAQRYFGLSSFPLSFADPDDMASRIWNHFTNPTMPEHERIVLASTMDYAVVYGHDLPAVISAFERYGAEHPNSSLGEQAAILKAADLRPDDMIGWRGTTVSDFWGHGWDEEKDEAIWYDPATNKHFDAFEVATKREAA